MSPLSNRTVNLVSVAALLALVGCQSAPEAAPQHGSFESLAPSVPVSTAVRSDSPAVVALGGSSAASPPVFTAIQPGSPAVRALAGAEAPPATPFVIECATDADCVVDTCDVTSCVSETSLLHRDFICAADAEAPHFDGCLCRAGRCGWTSSPAIREGI